MIPGFSFSTIYLSETPRIFPDNRGMKNENAYIDEEPREDVSESRISFAKAPAAARGKPSFLTREECLYV